MKIYVSILVVVEVVLKEKDQWTGEGTQVSFNPCCSGSCSERKKNQNLASE